MKKGDCDKRLSSNIDNLFEIATLLAWGGYFFLLLLPYFIISIITSINVSTFITLIATHLQFWRKIQTAYRFMQSP